MQYARSSPPQIGQNWWLSVWAAATEAADAADAHVATHYYLGVYFSLGVVSLAFQFLRGLCLLYGSLSAAQNLHADLVANVRLPTPHRVHCNAIANLLLLRELLYQSSYSPTKTIICSSEFPVSSVGQHPGLICSQQLAAAVHTALSLSYLC